MLFAHICSSRLFPIFPKSILPLKTDQTRIGQRVCLFLIFDVRSGEGSSIEIWKQGRFFFGAPGQRPRQAAGFGSPVLRGRGKRKRSYFLDAPFKFTQNIEQPTTKKATKVAYEKATRRDGRHVSPDRRENSIELLTVDKRRIWNDQISNRATGLDCFPAPVEISFPIDFWPMVPTKILSKTI